MPNSLETTVQNIIADAANSMATQIAHLVRQSISTEIAGNSHAVAAPVKRGPGRPKKVATLAAPAANGAAHAASAEKASGAGRKKGGKRARRSAAQVAADDEKILAFVKAHAGKRSEQIAKELKLSKLALASGLLRWREAGKIKTKGQKRATTYSAA
jgi:hypothetical protein